MKKIITNHFNDIASLIEATYDTKNIVFGIK